MTLRSKKKGGLSELQQESLLLRNLFWPVVLIFHRQSPPQCLPDIPFAFQFDSLFPLLSAEFCVRRKLNEAPNGALRDVARTFTKAFFTIKISQCVVSRKPNLMYILFLAYFVNLYTFRAHLDPSSGGTTVCILHLVLIIRFR